MHAVVTSPPAQERPAALTVEAGGFTYRAVVAPAGGRRFQLVVFNHCGAVQCRGRSWTRRGGIRRVMRWMQELALAEADRKDLLSRR